MHARKKITRTIYLLTLAAIFFAAIGCSSVKIKKTEMTAEQKKFRELSESARYLTPKEALELDKLVDKEPDNLDAVTKWLIYNRQRWLKDKKIKKKREKIIFHLIQNHPECSLFRHCFTHFHQNINDVALAKKLWKAQLKKHPENIKILSNAVDNLYSIDKNLYEKCLKKVQEIEPNNPKWSNRLGYFYELNNKYLKSYTEYKRAYKQSAVNKQRTILITLGEIAYILKKDKDAKKYAHEMIKRGEISFKKYKDSYPNIPETLLKWTVSHRKGTYLYNANTLLGLLALRDGKTKEACKYLIKSGEIFVSCDLPHFALDMSLACMLTFKKQDKTVLEHLETIAKHSPKSNCKAYIKDIKAGVMPEYQDMSYYNYVPLRNKIYTARRKQFLNIGKTLSAKQVAILEKELAKCPNKDIRKANSTITKLVAYYYINRDKDKTIPEKRRQLVYRLVEYFPRYSLLAYPETWLRSEKSDKKLVELCRVNIKKFRVGDACPLHKAAYQIATHDKKLAEEAFFKSYKVKPSASEKKKILARFHSRVKANKPYMTYKK